MAIAPQPTQDMAISPEGSVLIIPNTQGYQIEFSSVRDLQSLRQDRGVSTCAFLGDGAGALYWCMAKGRDSEFQAGMIDNKS